MAFWGAPISTDNHAQQAVEAAVKMEQNLIEFRRTLPPEFKDLDIGIGIHTGKVMCGFVGTKQRLDYTVLGDTVNLASRIEGKTKGSDRILVSQSTKALCSMPFNFIDEVDVKGRIQKVKLYTPER